MTATTRQTHDGLTAAPRGTFSGASLVTDYFGLESRTLRVKVRWHIRRGRGITARVARYRARLRDLRVAFGVTVYGPDRFGV